MIEQLIGALVFVETVPNTPHGPRKPNRCDNCVLRANHDSIYWADNPDGCLLDAASDGIHKLLQCSPHERADMRTGYFELRVAAPGVPNKAQVEMLFDSEEAEG